MSHRFLIVVRNVLIAVSVVLAQAAAVHPARATTGPSRPFGSHLVPYAAGSLLPSTQAARDAATQNFYDDWKATYLQAGCGVGRFFVNTHGDTKGRVVSEGQGYGMEMVALMAGYDPNAQAEFDGLYRYVQDHPSDYSPRLMAWSQDSSCSDVGGADSATDGDLSIAFGLLEADRQWGSAGAVDYLAEAKLVIGAIKTWEIDSATHLPNLGDWSRDSNKYKHSTRPSDFMIDHFRAFATATGDASWTQVANSVESLVATMQSSYASKTGLLPDFVVDTTGTPKPAPPDFLESRNDGKYSWNSCRTPWHLATDYLLSGDAGSLSAARKMSRWIQKATGGRPGKIVGGYTLGGSVLGHGWRELAFAAPFAVAASVDPAHAAWVDATWNNIVAKPIGAGGYYGDSLKMQAMLVLSNNAWLP